MKEWLDANKFLDNSYLNKYFKLSSRLGYKLIFL